VGVEYKDNRLAEVRPDKEWKGKVNLVWDVKGKAAALNKESKISGLNVLAPTWFSIISNSGLIASKAEAEYVKAAHQKGYKVWALVDNGFDPNMTHAILDNSSAREKLINQLIFYAALYQLDGINIDFENIYDDDKELLTEFVGELSSALKQQNLTVSMDVTVPANVSFWSKCFDRKKLSEKLDYIMVMTYDEYWASSPVSGPVASIGWVESSLKKTLNEVPQQKLLLGIPLYTRLWTESDLDGNVKAKSKTMSMMDVEKFIKEQNSEVVWLEDKGLSYTECYTDDKRYRIWIEDEKSLALKIGLANKYALAGIAAWRKGFERPEIWPVIDTALQKAGR
jgi:spore germination protein YaaH